MQVTETSVEGLKHEFKVVLPAAEIDSKVQQRLHEVSRTIRLPGFRPGKVPVDLLRKKYGESMRAEVLEAAVQDGTDKAMNERGLRPAMGPKVDIISFEDGGDLEFTLAVEALPEIEPVDFASLELVRERAEPDEDEIQGRLARLAKSRQTTEALGEDRPAETGDVTVIDFTGTVDGEEFAGCKGEGFELELDLDRFIPGFEEQLVGARAGERRTVKVTFPETYPSEDLAGKEAEFAVEVKELKQVVVPPLDDALAKALGLEDLEALKNAVREESQKEFDVLARMKLKRGLLDRLADGHGFPVPEGMVNMEFDTIWPRVEENLKRGQADPSDEGRSEDELKGEYRTIAERRVRLGLLLSEVGRVNNITVTQEELNRAILSEASRFPGQERQILDYYQKDSQALASLRAPLYEDKVIDFILEIASVEEKTVTPKELMSDPDAPAESEPEAPSRSKTAKKKPSKAGKDKNKNKNKKT